MNDRDEILERTDLVRLVEDSGVELRRRGANLLSGRCPFHAGGQERTPSFYVYEAQQRWVCYACDEGDTAIGYRMRAFGETTAEAIKALRENAGVRIIRNFTPAVQKPKPAPVPNGFVRSCHQLLLSKPDALTFLERERFLTHDTVVTAKLGLWRNEHGSWYLTIPIMDPDGYGWADVRKHLIKAAPQDTEPAKEKPYSPGRNAFPYVLSDLDFGTFALVCEGPMDCLAAVSIRLPAVTNTCGTSGAHGVWADHHTMLIQAPKVVICMDADEPGRSAAYGRWQWKHYQEKPEFHPGLIDVFPGATVLDLPEGEDLTDALRQRGIGRLKGAVLQKVYSTPAIPPNPPTEQEPARSAVSTPAGVAA